MSTTGKLIVIDGADGAGKATQTKLLVDRLRGEGRRVETTSFPQYEQNTFGKLLRECLSGLRGDFRKDGKVGDFASLDPRIASTLYAVDRFESRPQLEAWLTEGATVILDRYVSSNMLHQGSKIVGNEAALKEFLAWNDHVEHTIFGLPRPDTILYLDVPFMVRKMLMEKDAGRDGLDTVEKDEQYQLAAEECAKALLSDLNTWVSIPCTEGNALKGKEVIHGLVHAAACEVLESA